MCAGQQRTRDDVNHAVELIARGLEGRPVLQEPHTSHEHARLAGGVRLWCARGQGGKCAQMP